MIRERRWPVPNFSQIIRPAHLPAYEAAVALVNKKATNVLSMQVFRAPDAVEYEGFFRVQVAYQHPTDLFMLGYHLAQQLRKEGLLDG